MRAIWAGLFSVGCVAVGVSSGCGSSGGGVGQGGAGGTTTTTGTTTTSTTTTATTTTTTTTTSTGTGGTACAAASDCPGTDTDCHMRMCTSGMCMMMNVPSGTPVSMQTPGDCQQVVCDGNGGTMSVADQADAPSNGACTVGSCVNGAPTQTADAAGTACTGGPGKVCDGNGNCTGCVDGTDCASGVCQSMKCVAATCTDGVKNGTETDVDCGGPSCAPCGTDKACLVSGDCASSVCTSNVCVMATCIDGVRNGDETDVDCGGGMCDACVDGKKCDVDADCTSAVCAGTPLLCYASRCVDGVKDGNETDVDCGGSTCGACAVGKKCNVNADCASDICLAGVCSQYNGCDPTSAMDMTGMATVTIDFGGALGLVYSPKCIKVSAGTHVTFSGDFSSHPLVGGLMVNGAEMPAAAGTTPLPTSASGLNVGMSATFTMQPTGTYPYYCMFHGPIGMDGAIFVQ